MRVFLKRLFCFGIIVFLLFYVAPFIFSSYVYKLSDQALRFPNKEVLILGDSHTAYSLNDSILSDAINLSHEGTDYFYNYLKLRRIIELNPNISKVILNFGFFDFSLEKEKRYKESSNIRNYLPRYLFLMNYKDVKPFAAINLSGLLQAIPRVYKYNSYTIIKSIAGKQTKLSHYKIGGYVASRRNRLDASMKRAKRAKQTAAKYFAPNSDIELGYLIMIKNYCKEKNIELVLFNPPMHPVYIETRVNSKIRNNYINTYQKYFNDLELLDYSDYFLPDSMYGDMDHLNYKGANQFSTIIKNQF